eukprot:GGOE01018863.1.p1 GENE.GGOE01018863.1~~GGOE01018863.1.p1  ORF type:complete len:514 (+),score=98.28 GGOE01018863.1:191-1543(+)
MDDSLVSPPAALPATWIYVCPAADLPPGSTFLVRAPDGRNIVVFHTVHGLMAMDNACYHHGLPLRGGTITTLCGRHCVKCPWHGYLLELGTGEGLYVGLGPDMKTQEVRSKGPKQRTYMVERQGDAIHLLFDIRGDVASDEYASIPLSNREASGRVVAAPDDGASDVRSGHVLGKERPKPRPAGLAPGTANCKVRCVEVVALTPLVRSVTWEVVPTPRGTPFHHVAGQHAVFSVPALGPLRPALPRSWTISSAPGRDSNRFTIAVKRMPQGLASIWLHDRLQCGAQLEVLSVGGSFGCSFPQPIFQEKRGKMLMLAAGIGITPFIAMLRDLFGPHRQSNPNGVNFDIHLVYSEKVQEDFLFLPELQEFVTSDSGGAGHQLHLHLTVTHREPQVWGGLTGRITLRMIQSCVPDVQSRAILMCGPQGFMDDLQEQLEAAGVTQGAILRESFL